MTLSDDELTAIEARTNAATPGPWSDRENVEMKAWHIIWSDFGPLDVAHIPPWMAHCEFNACFIAAARTDVPRLIAEIRRQRAVLDQVDSATQRIEASVDRVTAQSAELREALQYLDAILAAYEADDRGSLVVSCELAAQWRRLPDDQMEQAC
jgi:hypothetical protein